MNDANLICNATIKAVIDNIVRFIPMGGTLVDVYKEIESLQAKRKQERLEEFYLALKDEIEVLIGQIKTTYISQTDFLDIFELTARCIVNERIEEKRILFRNILINSITKNDCSYDKTEKYLRTLEQMNNLELLILRILSDPNKYNEQQGEIIKDPNWISSGVRNGIQFTSTYNFIELLSELIKVSAEDISESMYFLEINRLVNEKASNYSLKTNGHPIHTLEGKLTPKGKDFISFILKN